MGNIMPKKHIRKFAEHNIRILRTIDSVFFSAFDVAQALDVKSPRALASYTAVENKTNTVNFYSGISEQINSNRLNTGMYQWKSDEMLPHETFFVDQAFIIAMALNDQVGKDKQRELILWSVQVVLEFLINGVDEEFLNEKVVENRNPVINNQKMYATTQIAAIFDMSPQKLNNILEEMKVQHKVSGQWILSNEYKDKGLTTSMIVNVDGEAKNVHTYWTAKGLDFIINIIEQLGYVRNGRIVEVEPKLPKQLSLFD